MDADSLYSHGLSNLAHFSQDIRKIFSPVGKITIPFGGGFPAPESFPVVALREILASLELSDDVLQYGRTAGYQPLRESLCSFLTAHGLPASNPNAILVGSGSQGIIDGLGKILLNRDDAILVEAPTFLGALQSFRFYGPRFIALHMDDQGIDPKELEKQILAHKPKCIYLIPTYQNPSGKTLPLERRKAIAEIITRHKVLLIEDDPYSHLSYYSAPPPSIYSLAPEYVVYLGTFSKILSPSFRVGFAVGPEKIIEALVTVKEGTDIATSTITQAAADQYLRRDHFDAHIKRVNSMYKERLEAMVAALEKYFPPEATYVKPHGGMFLWVNLGDGADLEAISQKAAAKGISFVSGQAFYAAGQADQGTMRLNFTNCSIADITKGIQELGGIVSATPGTRR